MNRRKLLKVAGSAAIFPFASGLANAEPATAQTPTLKGLKPYLLGGFSDFKHRCMAEVFKRDTAYMWPEVMYRDLPQEAGWIWGSLYDAGGDCHVVLRQVQPNVATVLALFHNRGSDACHIAMESMSGYRGPISMDKLKNGFRWRSADYGFLGASSFTITVEGDQFHWYEKDIVDIRGKLVPYAMQYYDPMPKVGQGQGYVCQFIRCEGTLIGRKVDGWLGYDFEYLAAGQVYRTSPMATRENEMGLALTWVEYANEYEDGSYEVAWTAVGLENWGFAAGYNSKGECWTGEMLHADFQLQPKIDVGEFPKSFQVRVWNSTAGKEEVFEWNSVPRTNLVDIPRVFPELSTYLSSEGVMTRLGDTRKIKRSVGYPDFYSDKKRHAAYQAQFKA